MVHTSINSIVFASVCVCVCVCVCVTIFTHERTHMQRAEFQPAGLST